MTLKCGSGPGDADKTVVAHILKLSGNIFVQRSRSEQAAFHMVVDVYVAVDQIAYFMPDLYSGCQLVLHLRTNLLWVRITRLKVQHLESWKTKDALLKAVVSFKSASTALPTLLNINTTD